MSVNPPGVLRRIYPLSEQHGCGALATVERDGQEIQRENVATVQGTMAESVLGLKDQPEYAFYFAGIRTMREEGAED